MTSILFDLCNTVMLLAWVFLLFVPKWSFTQRLIAYPWVPLGISFFYSYFLIVSGGLAEADFSTLEGITKLFRLLRLNQQQQDGFITLPLIFG